MITCLAHLESVFIIFWPDDEIDVMSASLDEEPQECFPHSCITRNPVYYCKQTIDILLFKRIYSRTSSIYLFNLKLQVTLQIT